MQRGLRRLGFTSIAALILVFGIVSAQAQNNQFSGRATAITTTVTVPPLAPVITRVNDAGPLGSSGGEAVGANGGATVPGILTVGASTVSTSGAGDTSESQASVADLDVNAAGVSNLLRVRAEEVSSSTQCTCPTATCTGSSTITNLRIGPNSNPTTVVVTGAPNQTFTRLDALGLVRLDIVINEQIVSPGAITVNALRITLTVLATGATTEVIVSRSHSDISCGVAPANNRFSGRATGVRLRSGGTLVNPLVNVVVSDAGPLPANGGDISVSTASVNTPPLLTTGVVESNTSGGVAGGGSVSGGGNVNTSQSESTVNNLSATLGGILTINATTLNSNTQCTCSQTTPTCTGDSTVIGGTVTGPGFTIAIAANAAPNTVITLPGGLGSITVNEQFGGGPGDDEITVNALHVRLLPRIGVARTDLIVASSHSDINCATTAGGALLSGRVLDPNGRAINRATVRLADAQGNVHRALTNPFGYFSFFDISVGESYIISVKHKQFRFEPRVVSLNEDLTGLDLVASP